MASLDPNQKDWQIAREMFGANTKHHCRLVKKMRQKGTLEPWGKGWFRITLPGDECGWLIPAECLLISQKKNPPKKPAQEKIK